MAVHGDHAYYSLSHSTTADPLTPGGSAATGDARRFGYRRVVRRSPFSYGPIDSYQEPYVGPPFAQRLEPFPGGLHPRSSYPSSDASVSTAWCLPPTACACQFPTTSRPPGFQTLQYTDGALSVNAPGEMKRLIRNTAEHIANGFAAAAAHLGGVPGFGPASTAAALPFSLEASSPVKSLEESPLANAAGSSDRARPVFAKASENEETSPVRRPASTERALALPNGQIEPASANDSAQQSSTATTLRHGHGRRRKATPRKSPSAYDPAFKGAVVEMQLLMIGGQPQLRMEHYYNDEQKRRSLGHHSSDPNDSEDGFGFVGPGKRCASCGTKTTPLWRAAEDGTLLCNACGIRFKKYRVRCARCWHVPMKSENKRIYCLECDGKLRVVARKPRT